VLWTRAGSHFEADLSYLELARQIWPRRYTQMLAWKPAWLVAVDAEDAAPHFVRTRDIRVSRRKFGPFPSGKAAEAFIAAIQDAFDLCRNVRCLRQAPDAAPCAYAQMGRCLSPCDGTISMSLYREVVRRAADCAAGDREPIRRQLHEEMNAAAKELAFERAATIKTRLERLAELDAPAYRHVAPLGQICYIVLQPSRSRRQVRAFLARGGNIADAGRLDWPLDDKQLTRLLEATGRHAEAPLADDAAGGWRFGLVAHYLHAGETKRGVFVRWREDLTPQRVGRIIEDNSKLLRLSQRKTKPGSSKSDEP
jgi:excinuclease UvrABC nuclease subunit